MKIALGIISAILIGFLITFGSIQDKISSQLKNKKTCGKQLSLLMANIPNSLDLSKSISYTDVFISNNIFHRLFNVSEDFQFTGQLAESWEVNRQSKFIDITIKNNASFSDGSPVTSKDVAFSLNRVFDTKALPSGFFVNLVSIKAMSEYSIRIFYRGWSEIALNALSSPFLSILKKGQVPVQENESSWITSDQYKITVWQTEKMEISDTGSCKGRNVQLVTQKAVNSGKYDVNVLFSRNNWISEEAVRTVLNKEDSNWRKYLFDSHDVSLLFLNSRIPIETRQCIFATLVNQNENSSPFANKLNSFLPRDVIGRKNIKAQPLPVVAPEEVSLSILMKKDSDVKDTLSELGKKLTKCNGRSRIVESNRGDYINKLVSGDFDIAIVTIAMLYNDPNFIFSFFNSNSKFNLSNVNDKELQSQLNELSEISNPDKYLTSIEKIQTTLARVAPAVPLFSSKFVLHLKDGLTVDELIDYSMITWSQIQ